MTLRDVMVGVALTGLVFLWATLVLRWPSLPARVATGFDLRGRPKRYGSKLTLTVPAIAMLLAFGIVETAVNAPNARLPRAGPVAVESFLAVLIWAMVLITGAIMDVASGKVQRLPIPMFYGSLAGVVIAVAVLLID